MNTKQSPRVLAIIPARAGSKGVPNKNIIDVHGLPLIGYSIREANKAVSLDAVIVSTDSEEIAIVARELGADVPFLRPLELATDTSRDIGYLQHALTFVAEQRDWHPEIVVFLPPTTPSRTAKDIDNAINLMDSTNADSVRTMVHPSHFNPYKMWKTSGEQGKVEPLFPEGRLGVPRQQLPEYYMPVGAVYATRSRCIQEGKLWGDDVRMIPFPLSRYTDIDTLEDLEEAKTVLQTHGLIP